MRYVSTRGGIAPLRFSDAVIEGLAADGGLLVPEHIPDLTRDVDRLAGLPFADLAVEIFRHFVDDIPESDLDRLVHAAFASFDAPDVTPLVQVGDRSILELFHGPTLAFKDVALQLLGQLFEYILEQRDESLNILGATSGDTGSAAIEGVRGKARITIFIMFPRGRTSRLQELQMTTVPDDNVHVLAVDGSFDDCQGILKSVLGDVAFKQRWRLGAVNSVNWARVMAQLVYYFHAGLRVGRATGRAPTIAVPTGNFGNVFAGWLAARMGLPVERFVLATNENDILARFFNTGTYRRGEVHYTVSPSMDIQVASNFERFLYYAVGEDPARLGALMAQFGSGGDISVDPEVLRAANIVARSVDTAQTLETIRRCWVDHRYLLDPHTAVGVAAGEALRGGGPLVCLSTAHPAKFPEAIDQALGNDSAGASAHHPRLDALAGLPVRSMSVAADPARIRTIIEAHAIRPPAPLPE